MPEGEGGIGPHARLVGTATVGIQTRGQVGREDPGTCAPPGVDASNRLGIVAFRVPVHSGSQKRVDHHVPGTRRKIRACARERLVQTHGFRCELLLSSNHLQLKPSPRLCELSGGDQAIAAVVSAPAKNCKTPLGGREMQSALCECGARILHQRWDRDSICHCATFESPNLRAGQDGLHCPASRTTVAAATPASWVKARNAEALIRSSSALASPKRRSDGAPLVRTTSMSFHRIPGGAPRALSSASFAAKRDA